MTVFWRFLGFFYQNTTHFKPITQLSTLKTNIGKQQHPTHFHSPVHGSYRFGRLVVFKICKEYH
jgi:hypothetical protein